MIKSIIFDLGNVLIFFDWKIAERKLNQIQENAGNLCTELLKTEKEFILLLETGRISEREFLNTIKKKIKLEISNELLALIFSDIFWENTELVEKLSVLKNSKKLYLLSNTNFIHRKYGWGKYKFLNLFDRLFLSYELGYVKPSKEIYDLVLNEIKMKPSEILYIDDISAYTESAKELGWNVINFKSNQDLFLKFRDFGIEL